MEAPIRTGKHSFSLLTVISLTICAASAQALPSSGQCGVLGVPVQVRSEGLTERLGDIELQCSGFNPGTVLSGNLTLFFPVNVTNRVDSNNLTRDAVVSVDSGSGLVATAIAGQVTNQMIAFNGVTLTVPATGNFSLKISGIRANANQLGLLTPPPVTALISSIFLVDQAQVTVAFPQIGLQASFSSNSINCSGSPLPAIIGVPELFAAGTKFVSTRVTEGFASAFETRAPGADTGTRFLVKYSGFPANAHLFLPDMVAGADALVPTAAGDLGGSPAPGQYVPGSGALLLVRVPGADSSGAGGFAVSPPAGSAPVTLTSASEVPLSDGAGFAVYEVADANPAVQQTAQFPTFIGLSGVTATAVAQESIELAPVSTVSNASVSAAIPRFADVTPPSDCNALGDCQASYFPRLMVDTAPIQFTATGSTMTSLPIYISIRNGAGGILDWSAVISYASGSGWLTLDSSSGQNDTRLRVSAQSQNLAPGAYHASITVNAGSAGSQTVPVTLTVQAAPPTPPSPPLPAIPAVTVTQVVNAATFMATPLVSGSLGTLIGSNLAGKNVAVTFDGNPAALLYTGAGQINFQVPAVLGSKTSATMVVTVDGSSSAPMTVALSPAWPSIFAHGVLNQDNSENTSAGAAPSGSILQIFATGIPEGATVSVQIGDRANLAPLYAADAPTVPGVQQVNVAVPGGLPPGTTPLIICATTGSQQYCSAGYSLAVQ